jgi:hypothetical protein
MDEDTEDRAISSGLVQNVEMLVGVLRKECQGSILQSQEYNKGDIADSNPILYEIPSDLWVWS